MFLPDGKPRYTNDVEFSRLVLAQVDIAGEPSKGEEVYAALRVGEKLRRPLSTLAGTAGYRSLIARALTLAKKEVPSLGGGAG